MSYVTDEQLTERLPVSDACTCEPFDAIYTLRNGVLVCLKCGKPRPVVLHPDDRCEACGGRGCTYCNSWGCMP